MVSDAKSTAKTEYGSPRATVDPGVRSGPDLTQTLQEAREQTERYIAAQLGRAKALARSAVLFGVLGIAGAFVAITIAIMACVLLCDGIAGGLGQLLGGRLWAGELITGLLILGAIGAGAYIAVGTVMKAARKRTVATWAERRTRGPIQ